MPYQNILAKMDPRAMQRAQLWNPLAMAGANMLAMSGPSTTPQGIGPAVGAGLQGFGQARDAGTQQMIQRYMLGMQMDEQQRKQQAEERRETERSGALEAMPAEDRPYATLGMRPPTRPQAEPGPFRGTGMDQQATNVLLNDDPSSPTYAAAYSHLSQPRASFDPVSGQMVTIKPDMSAFRPPARTGATAESTPTATVTPVTPPRLPPGMQAKSAELETKFNRISRTVDTYDQTLKEFGPTIAAGPLTGPKGAQLKTAYTDMLLEMKELANLGVLNGPDYMLMTQMLVDPTSIQAQRLGTEGLLAQTQRMRQKLDAAKADAMRIYEAPGLPRTTAAKPEATDEPSQEDLEYTAKKHGMTVEQVKEWMARNKGDK